MRQFAKADAPDSVLIEQGGDVGIAQACDVACAQLRETPDSHSPQLQHDTLSINVASGQVPLRLKSIFWFQYVTPI